jgi:hypothetical protein
MNNNVGISQCSVTVIRGRFLAVPLGLLEPSIALRFFKLQEFDSRYGNAFEAYTHTARLAEEMLLQLDYVFVA